MMRQYMEIKEQFSDCLLFYRMGDFYELFLDDAHIGAKILNITLTTKAAGKNTKVPMAGVPFHAVDTYLTRLVKAGFKVAICEQMTPPSGKGIIKREVVRIVTPGTLLDENALEKKGNNFIVSVWLEDNIACFAVADLSTGFFGVYERQTEDPFALIQEELAKLNPAECIVSPSHYDDAQILGAISVVKGMNIFSCSLWDSFATSPSGVLKEHFRVATLEGYGVSDDATSLIAAAALLGYLKDTQKSDLTHIKRLTKLGETEHMLLDRSTMINLELFSTIREHDSRGSLLSVLDETLTAMGGRMIRQWTSQPLIDHKQISNRLDVVDELVSSPNLQENLRESLKTINDIERLTSRLSVGLGNARDLINLKSTLSTIMEVRQLSLQSQSDLLRQLSSRISLKLDELIHYIGTHIADEPPIDLRSGGMIRPGIHQKLDQLRGIVHDSKSWIAEFEQKERQRTGISSLKVRFNKVFGFYIEVSKSNISSVPEDYYRKQTLVNGERFITPELKKQEEIILTAEETINDIEYTLFHEALAHVLAENSLILDAGEAIAQIDCLSCLAYLAQKNHYIRPTLVDGGQMQIAGGRHPVVEKLVESGTFVPNDVSFGATDDRLHLITGPNMAGKSVYIRQVALIQLMAQMGSFVPATQAQLGIIDRIFVRSGASDVITSGLSTFMVEMVETAYILNHATSQSLIVMDEIGRGTSTYDGISIAWAVAEYLATHFKVAPKTLFATHYHELQKLEEYFPQVIKNYSMAVADNDGQPVFLHTVVDGGASSSFGVAVAKLAGIPQTVIETALNKLQVLENKSDHKTQDMVVSPQFESLTASETELFEHLLIKELSALEIHTMTPIEALNKLSEMKEKLKLVQTSPHATHLESN
jgi:DNA mismatch repair protein MutS